MEAIQGAAIPVAVFIAVYILITFELVNKAVAALLGVSVLVMLNKLSLEHAVQLIDAETIMLLLGMMIIVSILKKSGVFSLISVKIAEMTNGSPMKILVLFSVVTALMSAFLDNVTTVLIIIPIIIELTKGMGLDPKLYVISQALIANIGGTATLIGDPPNIIIGSKAGLSFNEFIISLGPVIAVIFAATIFYLWATNKQSFKPIDRNIVKLFSVQMLLEKIRFDFLNSKLDRKLMIKGLVCLGIAILLFITQTATGITPGIAALVCAMFLLVISRYELEEIAEDIEWSTLMFFAGLFVLVGALEHYGVIEWIAKHLFLGIGENSYLAVLMIVWISGIASGFLDNIPFTITMVPIIKLMLQNNPVPNNILWWALALGACLGGNLTMIGASANIVSTGIAKKNKENISFMHFLKYGAPVTIISLAISSIYLLVYLRLSQ